MSDVSGATGWSGFSTDGQGGPQRRENHDFTTATGCRIRVFPSPYQHRPHETILLLTVGDGRSAEVLLQPLDCAMLAAALETRS